jgi:hypothetical protein
MWNCLPWHTPFVDFLAMFTAYNSFAYVSCVHFQVDGWVLLGAADARNAVPHDPGPGMKMKRMMRRSLLETKRTTMCCVVSPVMPHLIHPVNGTWIALFRIWTGVSQDTEYEYRHHVPSVV